LNKDGLTLALKREKMSDNFTETISVVSGCNFINLFGIQKYYAKLISYKLALKSIFDLEDGMACASLFLKNER
jgi:hypothetical protein